MLRQASTGSWMKSCEEKAGADQLFGGSSN